jgi:hypothetical protein
VHQPLAPDVVAVEPPDGAATDVGSAAGRSGEVNGNAADNADVSNVRRIPIKSRPMGNVETQPCSDR